MTLLPKDVQSVLYVRTYAVVAASSDLAGCLLQVLKILEAQFQKRHYTPAQATAVLSFDTESVRRAVA